MNEITKEDYTRIITNLQIAEYALRKAKEVTPGMTMFGRLDLKARLEIFREDVINSHISSVHDSIIFLEAERVKCQK
jgi:hypothetical protein